MNSKDVKNKNDILSGQISIFEYEKLPKVVCTGNVVSPDKNKSVGLNLTLDQKIRYSDLMKNKLVRRVILYCSGIIGVEVWSGDVVKTICVFKDGHEFSYNTASGVLPADKIVFYSGFKIKDTRRQLKRLNDLKKHAEIKRIVRRKGDLNILVEFSDKLVSILPNGWVLEFYLMEIEGE